MNRQITGRISTYHFAPTDLSKKNLLAEDIAEEAITVTGNTVIDALYMVVDKIKTDDALSANLKTVLSNSGYDVNRLSDGRKNGFDNGTPSGRILEMVSSQCVRP